MEKISEALQALKAMQQKAEEISQRELQSYEENLKAISANGASMFVSDIADRNWKELAESAELSKAHLKCQKEKYQQIEAMLDQHMKVISTQLKSQEAQVKRFARLSGLAGSGIIGMSLGVAGMSVAWSLMITRPQTAALEEKNSALQQKVKDLQKKVNQQQPKAQRRN
jgi:hypothetical protein